MSTYIQFPGITGECAEANHTGWVEVNSISLPISRSITSGAVGVARSGTTTLGDIAVHKSWDSSSPVLWARVGSGKNQDPVTIELCSDMGGNTVCNLQLVLTNTISSSYSLSASGDMSPTPSELLTLNYEKLSWTYTPYKPDGTAGGAVTASVDTSSGATSGD
jgi:type VI secretion system secreted protein Hcp